MAANIIVAFACLFAGFIQAVTGFGGAVTAMVFFPLVTNLNQAPALSNIVNFPLSAMLAWRYRKFINIKTVILPTVIYLIVSTAAIHISGNIPQLLLRRSFGVFLIILSLYFLFVSDKLLVKPTIPIIVSCSVISGLTGGLFGIGGPPMVLCFLAASEKKEEYLGNVNAFFTITVIANIYQRIVNGYVTEEMFPLILIGVITILAGCLLGNRLSDKINVPVMKKCIYFFLIISGIAALF